MAPGKLNLQYQLASIAPILFALYLLPDHYAVADPETVKYMINGHEHNVKYSTSLNIVARKPQVGFLASNSNDHLLHLGAFFESGDVVQLSKPGHWFENGLVYVNDTINVILTTSLLPQRWGWIEKKGSDFLGTTSFFSKAEFTIRSAPGTPPAGHWPPVYTYYLEYNGVRLGTKTINGITYIEQGKGDGDLEISFVPYAGEPLGMSTDA